MEKFENPKQIWQGDFLNNEDVDSACFKRLCRLCADYGDEGKTAKNLLAEVKRLLEIY